MNWLVEMYGKHPPGETFDYVSLDARIEHSRDGLENGSDAIWHYGTSTSQVVVFVVICCPHRHHIQTPCPLPPT
ncbi:hypothetical protein AB0M54_45930 [Actinoplanes sp. NPDC051470]|uniref:hypothetical protein n=1 Tax=Actinoplanes sp. NPDC051470 TaxID=3157224 RepID=UPI003437143F